MHLSTHHKVALGGAAVTSAIALTDAATHGLTGGYSAFSDESGARGLVVLSSIAHGITYLALLAVLVREAGRFAATNRVARLSRWLVMAGLAVLGVGFVTFIPVIELRGGGQGRAYDVVGIIAGPAFLAMILGSLVLGLALLRSRALGAGARVLALMVPVLGVTALLGWLAPDWAHPAYLETTLHVGLALLGVGTAASPPAGKETPGAAARHGVERHRVPAVVLVVVAVAALTVDTVITATTGERTFLTDDARGTTTTTLIGAAVLGATFAALALVVWREGARFADARRAARLARPVLLAGLIFLAVGFVTVYPAQLLAGVETGRLADLSGTVAFVALSSVVLSSVVLGLSLIGRNTLGIGGAVLGALGPVIALTGFIAVVAPDLASPVYSTAVVLAGTALLGVRAPDVNRPERDAVGAQPSAMA